ncbi:DUF1206 domain-containing protein [Parenemella sanctibonifatiensis]|nr:DUF1206 domain-containing protein [Parenemella sanctibonifatiensis]
MNQNSSGDKIRDGAKQASQKAEDHGRDAGQKVQQSTAYKVMVSGGLVAYGLVHLLIGWLGLQMAWSGDSDQEASQQGALQQLAAQPFGVVLLWVTAIGLFTLVVWQLLAAAFGHQQYDGSKRWRKRGGSVAKAVVYGALGAGAVRAAMGGGGSQEQSNEGLTAQLLAMPFGQVLVVVVGLVVVGVGGYQIFSGITQRFAEELDQAVSSAVLTLGTIGSVAKGLAMVIVGGLFVWAAVNYDPEQAGGMDQALQTVRGAPFGQMLLTLMAVGIACYGLFCFVWARHPRNEQA